MYLDETKIKIYVGITFLPAKTKGKTEFILFKVKEKKYS